MADNPQVPGFTSETYIPDALVAGDLKIVAKGDATLLSGQNVVRGTVLGQVSLGAVSVAAGGGNTGNGTFGPLTLQKGAMAGVYKLTALSATLFEVLAPNGDRLNELAVGAAYADGFGGTITAGGMAFVAGDTFAVTVAAGAVDANGNFKWKESVASAFDGSQNPAGIAADAYNATAGDINFGVYETGEFNSDALTYDGSWTLPTLSAALRLVGIFVKGYVPAAPASNA
jgi:hypothetical protein